MIKSFEFTSSTGAKVYAQKWINEEIKGYKGVIQLVHGMQEHIGRYDEFANVLADCGYIVVGHDHLGHGSTAKCEEDFGYFADVDGWERLVDDIHILQNQIQKEYPELPYVIMGHSMGSLLVRTYLTKYKDNISGVIISGTSGQKRGLISGRILTRLMMLFMGKRYKSNLLEYLVTGSFNKKFKPKQTKSDWTTSDYEQVEKYQKDPKCGKNFTAVAYYDLLKRNILSIKTKKHKQNFKCTNSNIFRG